MQRYNPPPNVPIWNVALDMAKVASRTNDTVVVCFAGVELTANPKRVPEYEAARIVVRYADAIGIK